MDGYDLQRAVRPFVRFIEDLTNWYIRRSRRRFWKSQDDLDKAQAYETLHTVLVRLSQIAAPFVPFIAEAIYRNLRTDDMPESVHLCEFPVPEGKFRDTNLEQAMDRVMTCVRLGRSLRTEYNLKVRQPLAALHIVTSDTRVRDELEGLQDIIEDELNVKRVVFGDRETELANLKAKPDFRRMGPRLGPRVKAAAKALAQLPTERLANLADGSAIDVDVDGEAITVEPDDVVIERIPREGLVVATEGRILVAIETELTDELVQEGLAREVVNKIQNMRKDADLEVTQRIRVRLSSGDEIRHAVEVHADYIEGETLTTESSFEENLPDSAAEWDINGRRCRIAIEPAN
jgi:isoleucyl-tRNA synthetase